MTNLCDVCGKPATQSMLRDPFGKSDEMRFVCSDHGFRIRDPADVAAIEQLHAAVKTAQELAATRLMEIAKLNALLAEPNYCARCGVNENEPSEQHTYDVVAYSESGQTGYGQNDSKEGFASAEEAIAYAKSCDAYLNATAWQRRKPSPVVYTSVQIYPNDCRVPPAVKSQGASRDASSIHDQGFQTEAGCSPAEESCASTAPAGNPDDGSKRASPADLVGALQDVVHTDPGPVRTGKAVRDASSGSNAWADAKGGLPDNKL